jgi:cell division protein FtsB
MSTKFKQKKRVLSSILEAKKGKLERHIETLDDGNETLAKFAKTVIN